MFLFNRRNQKKNKIYDIDFNSVVNNNIYPEIKEILYCTPTNKRSYEKKYYDLQDLPNIEIEEKTEIDEIEDILNILDVSDEEELKKRKRKRYYNKKLWK